MALRLVRETSDTPNITNKDDTIMTRYAYGGYNGVVKGFGSECEYTAENGIFKVLDGRIVIDGWEIDIDGAGWSVNLSNVSGIQYYSIYAEINVLVESIEIKSTYSLASYPIIEKGDDLTSIPNGTARLLLYNVKVSNGYISEVLTKFSKIINLREVVDNLTSGKTVVGNATNTTKVNSLELKRDENGVLKIGNIIIPQKKLLWKNESGFEIGFDETFLQIEHTVSNKVIEVVFRMVGNTRPKYERQHMGSSYDAAATFDYGAAGVDGSGDFAGLYFRGLIMKELEPGLLLLRANGYKYILYEIYEIIE